jgi:hypothetical protein
MSFGGSKSGKPWERFRALYCMEIRVMRRMTESVKPFVLSLNGCMAKSGSLK